MQQVKSIRPKSFRPLEVQRIFVKDIRLKFLKDLDPMESNRFCVVFSKYILT